MLKNIKFLSNNCDPLMYQDIKKKYIWFKSVAVNIPLKKSSNLTCGFLMTCVSQQYVHAELLVYPWS